MRAVAFDPAPAEIPAAPTAHLVARGDTAWIYADDGTRERLEMPSYDGIARVGPG
jgi:hypothetical protein